MKTMKTMKTTLILAAVLALPSSAAHAQTGPGPSIPPALRSQAPSSTPAASGEALQQQALHKLRRRFEEADLDASGKLTEEEARRAGLGFISSNFAAIDSARKGAVSFDDVNRFLEQRKMSQQRTK